MYQETNEKGVIRLADKAFIPFAEGNRDYKQYRAWLADGNQPEPVEQLNLPPDRLPKLLVLERLQAAGKFDAAHTALIADPYLYERWLASVSVDPEDADVQGLLTAIEADLETVLAPE